MNLQARCFFQNDLSGCLPPQLLESMYAVLAPTPATSPALPWQLATAGAAPVRALAIGRATREQRPKMIEWTEHALSVEVKPSIWDADF
jgi:hypothetical protein